MSTETDADTHGYEDCIPGTFYGFTETENNTFQPGDSFPLRWGAVDTSIYNPLNISLAKPGGEIVDEIVGTLPSFNLLPNIYNLKIRPHIL